MNSTVGIFFETCDELDINRGISFDLWHSRIKLHFDKFPFIPLFLNNDIFRRIFTVKYNVHTGPFFEKAEFLSLIICAMSLNYHCLINYLHTGFILNPFSETWVTETLLEVKTSARATQQ